MLVVTTDTLAGYTISEAVGLVEGTSDRQTFSARSPSEEAVRDMSSQARRLGADAVVGVRVVVTGDERTNAVHTYAYGTAVTLAG